MFGESLFTLLPGPAWTVLPGPAVASACSGWLPFGGFPAVLALFLGVVRNQRRPLLIRFNVLQAILLDIVLNSCVPGIPLAAVRFGGSFRPAPRSATPSSSAPCCWLLFAVRPVRTRQKTRISRRVEGGCGSSCTEASWTDGYVAALRIESVAAQPQGPLAPHSSPSRRVSSPFMSQQALLRTSVHPSPGHRGGRSRRPLSTSTATWSGGRRRSARHPDCVASAVLAYHDRQAPRRHFYVR